ncbi:MAG: exodeoxyribonuclease III [Chitinophagales bacterium]
MNDLSIISYNVNGIRAAIKKGLIDWIKNSPYQVFLFQEIKADEADVPTELFTDLGFECHWFSAQKKGYSGVGVVSKVPLTNITKGMNNKLYDAEGRIIRFNIGDMHFINAYFPSGSSGDERQAIKMEFLDDFYNFVDEVKQTHQKIVIAGDYNICHEAIDIHNPVGNKNSSGFLPEERAWMTKFFDSGFIDSFRSQHPNLKDQYTWWSFRANARVNNKGWRIDYLSCSNALSNQIIDTAIFPDVKQSDHCPILLKLKL